MMSFSSMDLMVDVLPVGNSTLRAAPGLGMCAQGTTNDRDEDDEDGDEEEDGLLECAQGTATNPGPASVTREGRRWTSPCCGAAPGETLSSVGPRLKPCG